MLAGLAGTNEDVRKKQKKNMFKIIATGSEKCLLITKSIKSTLVYKEGI